MPAPDDVKIEVEFVPGSGTWVDVTSYVDWSAKCTTSFGRSSMFSPVQPSRMTVTFFNNDNRFTPNQQTLADGSVHPYWPNLLPRRRIRRQLQVAGLWYTRFLGYIKGWPPGYKSFNQPRVTVTAEDRMTRLTKVNLGAPVRSEIMTDQPAAYWPLNDPQPDAGVPGAVEVIKVGAATDMVQTGGQVPLVFGSPGLTEPDGTAVSGNPTNTTLANSLFAYVPVAPSPLSVNLWVNFPGVPSWFGYADPTVLFVQAQDPTYRYVYLDGSGRLGLAGNPATPGTLSGFIADGRWHLVTLTDTGKFYVDGVLVTSAASLTANLRSISVSTPAPGQLAQLTLYRSTLTSARIGLHVLSGRNFDGELSGERLARYLRLAGVPATDYSLDTSALQLNSAPQDGVDVVTAMNAVAASEAGRSVIYVNPAGQIRFIARAVTDSTTPLMTLDAEADIDGAAFDPSFGDDQLMNRATGVRADATGTIFTYSVSDDASIAAYDLFDAPDLTSNARSNTDVVYATQDRLARNRQPSLRLETVTVDLRTAEQNLFQPLSQLDLQARIRVTNLPRAVGATLNFFLEGGEEIIGDDTYLVRMQLSPEVSPTGVSDDGLYGRAQADGITLGSALTNSAGTIQLSIAAGMPAFSTSAGDYPLNVVINTEVMSIASAAAAAGGTQALTVAARGQQSTAPSSHTAGSLVQVYQPIVAGL